MRPTSGGMISSRAVQGAIALVLCSALSTDTRKRCGNIAVALCTRNVHCHRCDDVARELLIAGCEVERSPYCTTRISTLKNMQI